MFDCYQSGAVTVMLLVVMAAASLEAKHQWPCAVTTNGPASKGHGVSDGFLKWETKHPRTENVELYLWFYSLRYLYYQVKI